MAQFRYRSMTPEDVIQVRELYIEFWKRETIAKALKMEVPRECEKFVEYALEDAPFNQLSVVAEDTLTGKLVGMNAVVLATPGDRKSWIFPQEDPNCRTMKRSYSILDQLYAMPDYFSHFGVKNCLLSRGIVVLEEYDRRGIGTKLMQKTLGIARDLGVQLVLMDCTSPFSRRICEKLSFEQVSLIDLADKGVENLSDDNRFRIATLHALN
ncbi:arylalkylamine N-acetyltransferase-like 2 [Liolophura sinensis]|uniref:arylalkylamine N-acetyltransferase-like 2 n=1 Tax=Liolophura sinensis TaxID=3198878 RepID=UPI0031590202